MKITHDKKYNVMYIKLTASEITSTKRVSGDVNLDFDADGKLVGIELLDASYIQELTTFDYEDITGKHQESSEVNEITT